MWFWKCWHIILRLIVAIKLVDLFSTHLRMQQWPYLFRGEIIPILVVSCCRHHKKMPTANDIWKLQLMKYQLDQYSIRQSCLIERIINTNICLIKVMMTLPLLIEHFTYNSFVNPQHECAIGPAKHLDVIQLPSANRLETWVGFTAL